MYGGTRAYDYQIVEADQYRGVQVWGLYHVGADFSIVENTSEHWGRGKTVDLYRLRYSLSCWSVTSG